MIPTLTHRRHAAGIVISPSCNNLSEVSRSPRTLLSTLASPLRRSLPTSKETNTLSLKRPRSDSQTSETTSKPTVKLVRRLSKVLSLRLFQKSNISTPSQPASPSSASVTVPPTSATWISERFSSVSPSPISLKNLELLESLQSGAHLFPRSAWSDYSDSESGENVRERAMDLVEYDFENDEDHPTGLWCELEENEEVEVVDFILEHRRRLPPPPGPPPTCPLPPLPTISHTRSQTVRLPLTDFDGDFWPTPKQARRWSM